MLKKSLPGTRRLCAPRSRSYGINAFLLLLPVGQSRLKCLTVRLIISMFIFVLYFQNLAIYRQTLTLTILAIIDVGSRTRLLAFAGLIEDAFEVPGFGSIDLIYTLKCLYSEVPRCETSSAMAGLLLLVRAVAGSRSGVYLRRGGRGSRVMCSSEPQLWRLVVLCGKRR